MKIVARTRIGINSISELVPKDSNTKGIIAKKLGISKPYFYDLLKENKFTINQLDIIATYLGYTMYIELIKE